MGKKCKTKKKKKSTLKSVGKWDHPHFHSLSQDLDYPNPDFCLRCCRALPLFLIPAGGWRSGCAVCMQNDQNAFCPLQNVLCICVNDRSADLPPCENIL